MQSRNKAVIVGVFAGSALWSCSHSLVEGLEAVPVAGWAVLLMDMDSPYEFVCKHTRRPAASSALPFGRSLSDYLQSFGQGRFLHSFFGFALFFAFAKAVPMLHINVYADFCDLVAVWIVFSLTRQLWHAIKASDFPHDEFYGWFYLLGIGIFFAILYLMPTPWHGLMPSGAFFSAFVMGAGGNIALELLGARGVPLLWPLRQRVRLPLIGETGGAREPWVVGLFFVGWFFWWSNNYPTPHHAYGQIAVAASLAWAAGIKYLKRHL